ncbi:MAG: hypothetical protein ABJP45_09650 [Cyclobacteriaceae bacterium]
MKKLFLTVFAVGVLGYSSMAQFHIELGPNFNSPQGDFADAYDLGIGFYIEPKYAINENIDLGLYLGANVFAGGDVAGTNTSLDAQTLNPYLATGTYRFSTNKVTPYAGLGLGLYVAKAVDITTTSGGVTTTIEGESNSEFGFAPRAGVYVGRLNLGLAYNLVKDSNFLQFNLGIRILSRD